MPGPRHANTYPMRAVVDAADHEGHGGLFMNRGGVTIRWWELTLECGHQVERSARYEKGAAGGRGWAALHHPAPWSSMLPAPKRVRCEICGRKDS